MTLDQNQKNRIRQGNWRAIRLLAGLTLLVLAPLALGLLWVRWDYWSALRKLEQRLGPLTTEALGHAEQVPDEENAAAGLLAAGGALVLSEAEGKALSAALQTEGFPPPEVLAPLVPLLVTNRRALALTAEALELPGLNWGVDYSLGSKAPLPNLLPQLKLARLIFLRGAVATHHGDAEGLHQAAALLGRHAEALYGEGLTLFVLIGRASERLQHRLLAAAIADPRVDDKATLELLVTSLPAADLEQVYEHLVHHEAVFLRRMPEELAQETSEGAGRLIYRLMSRYSVSGALRDHLRILNTYPLPWEQHLSLRYDPGDKSMLENLRHMMVPKNFWDMPSSIRVVGLERQLLNTGLQLRLRRLDGAPSYREAAERLGLSAAGSSFELITRADGGAEFFAPEIESYKTVFPDNPATPTLISRLRLPDGAGPNPPG